MRLKRTNVIGTAALLTTLAAAWAPAPAPTQRLRPDLTGATDAELHQVMNQRFDEVRSRPWFTAWAPALSHDAVADEVVRRLKSEMRSRDHDEAR